MKQDEIIYRNILENMTDGVMTISLDGRIITFNEAAETILNFKRDDVLNQPFGEIFLTLEGNDDFNQTVLNAVYDAAIVHNSDVTYRTEGKVLTLSVTTSFLQSKEADGIKKAAVIVVFSDRTEVEHLRDTEIQLGKEIKAKHKELQDAFIELEDANTNLQTALKKVQTIRIAATVFVIILFLVIGIVTWIKATPGRSAPAHSFEKRDPASTRTYTVQPQTLTDSIALRGILKPIKIVNVTSPFAGQVKERLFEYGQPVTKGQILLRLDVSEIETKYRDAKTAFIEADDNYRKVKNWNESDEMAKASRDLNAAKRKYQETEVLYKKGIESANSYESDKKSYEDQLASFKAEKAKGEGDKLTVAKLKYENAKVKLAELQAQVGQANIIAPVSGTILLAELADKDKKGKTAEKGTSFSQGEILLAIGDTGGLAVSAEVDEMEVMKIKKGQEVAITGDAFPGIILKGKVNHLSSQAGKGADGGSRKTASFEITVTVDQISPEESDKVRLGMTANVTIMILNRPNTILLPIGAVRMEGPDRVVVVSDKQSKEGKTVKVETGITTVDSVEITKGLRAGDEVLLP